MKPRAGKFLLFFSSFHLPSPHIFYFLLQSQVISANSKKKKNSVDETTDALIQRIIRQKFARHTIIAVAHKLETIIDFDKVAVLHNGELCEFDGPHALLAREDSRFRQLYRGGKGRFSREE